VGGRLDGGIIITKHGHAQGPIGSLLIREAGHPVPDQDTFSATEEALALTDGLTAEDTVLFLLSGGGSALFEAPLVPQEELQSITQSLLASGADIVEMNTIRKRLSAVKGGRFAQHCAPAKVFSIVLSDIIGDPLDMIASGPAYPDSSTCADARRIAEQYGLRLSPEASQCLERETPKVLDNVETLITGSVRELCAAASAACRELGYEPVLLTDSLDCEAREAGAFLAAVARAHQDTDCSLAFLAGGETVVHLTGSGLGGRNQELALSAAAVRVYVLNWTEQATEKYLQFQAGESAAERVARWQEAYVPSTVPRDYQISAAAYSESSKFIEYANTAGDRLLFFQYPGSAAVRIDTEAADREVDWFGQKAYLFLKEGTAMVTWDGGDCIFSIEYDPEAVTDEEIKEMAKSLEWK